MTGTQELTYTTLPSRLYSWVAIQRSPAPQLCLYNQALADELGLDQRWYQTREGLLTGVPDSEDQRFLAQAYAGHQFGHFTNLGDGRAALLGEIRTPGGDLWDLQFKGSGPTPYSRQGDGKAALGPMLREYLMGEALHAQHIPSTRILSVAATGETVWRSEALPGALAVRAAWSHLRVGTFQYAAARGGEELVKALADYTLDRHYPLARTAEAPYLALFQAVAQRKARLVARWMGTGFVHGVMNTDNMALSGQTLDFGPCAFLDDYDPLGVFSSIDHGGRYAYGNQPVIAQWNLVRWIETLLPLLAPTLEEGAEVAQKAADSLPGVFTQELALVWASKLGVDPRQTGAGDLVGEYLVWMEQASPDFARAFRGLSDLAAGRPLDSQVPLPGSSWLASWEKISQASPEARGRMDRWNPLYIPRNYWVEEALSLAQEGDWEAFRNLEIALRNPAVIREGLEYLSGPGPKTEQPFVTFCGT